MMPPSLRNLLCIALVAAMIVGCASRAPRRAPQQGEAKSSSQGDVKYDKFTGSCEAWEKYIASKGVQDCNGRSHPGWMGVTNCSVSASGYEYTPQRDEGVLGRVCMSVELPRNPNQFKIASACVRIVDWVPPTAIPESCSTSRANWLDQVLRHEQYHVYQCDVEVWKANQRWVKESHKFTACAFSENGATDKLNEQINQALSRESERIMELVRRESARFHASSEGKPVVTNCGACR